MFVRQQLVHVIPGPNVPTIRGCGVVFEVNNHRRMCLVSYTDISGPFRMSWISWDYLRHACHQTGGQSPLTPCNKMTLQKV